MTISMFMHIYDKLILSLLLGFFLAFVDTSTITEFLFLVLGVYLFLITIENFIISCKELKHKTPVAYEHFFTNLIIIVSSILMIFIHEIIGVIAGVTLIAFSLITIHVNKEPILEGLKNESIQIGLGIILIIFGFAGVLDIAFTIIGWVLIITSSFSILIETLAFKVEHNND